MRSHLLICHLMCQLFRSHVLISIIYEGYSSACFMCRTVHAITNSRMCLVKIGLTNIATRILLKRLLCDLAMHHVIGDISETALALTNSVYVSLPWGSGCIGPAGLMSFKFGTLTDNVSGTHFPFSMRSSFVCHAFRIVICLELSGREISVNAWLEMGSLSYSSSCMH